MAVEVWQAARPKVRPPRWAFRVTAGDAVTFESAWVAVRFAGRGDAEWLAGLIDALAERGAFPGCPGHPGNLIDFAYRDSSLEPGDFLHRIDPGDRGAITRLGSCGQRVGRAERCG